MTPAGSGYPATITGRGHRRVLLGTHTFGAAGGAGRRQSAAIESMRALHGVELVNVQFADEPHEIEGVATLAVLRRDSNTVSRLRGPRKPLVNDILEALSGEAHARGFPAFWFANGDILVSQAAVDVIGRGGYDAIVLFREDLDPRTGRARGMHLWGADAVAFTVEWWRAHRGRFRGYVLGEPGWDNVYTAIAACHGSARLESRTGLIRHEAHEAAWTDSPFAQYTGWLLARDAGYFRLWCTYQDALARARDAGATEAGEAELARGIFTWPPSPGARVTQGLRTARAWARYLWRTRSAAGTRRA